MLIAFVLCVPELIGYVIFGTVIQEVKTSNLAREVGRFSNTIPHQYPDNIDNKSQEMNKTHISLILKSLPSISKPLHVLFKLESLT